MTINQPSQSSPPRTQERIWHDLFLPPDVGHIRPMARAAVEKHLAPVARQIAQTEERRDSFPWGAFQGLASEGCFAVPFPAPHGAGLEHPNLATCIVTEEIAYESSSRAGVYDGQCILNARALSFAAPEIRDRVLPALIAGDSVFSFATTEPDASSDLSPTSMRAGGLRRGSGSQDVGARSPPTSSSRTLPSPASTCWAEPVGASPSPWPHWPAAGSASPPPGSGSLRLPSTSPSTGCAAASCSARSWAPCSTGSTVWPSTPPGWRRHAPCTRRPPCLDRGDPSGEPEASMAKSFATTLANDLARDALQVYGGYGFARQVAATVPVGGDLPRRQDPRDLRGRQRGPAVGDRPGPDRPRRHRLAETRGGPVGHTLPVGLERHLAVEPDEADLVHGDGGQIGQHGQAVVGPVATDEVDDAQRPDGMAVGGDQRHPGVRPHAQLGHRQVASGRPAATVCWQIE